jgi:hypothetical protein
MCMFTEDSLLGQLMTYLDRTYGGTQPEGAGSTWRVGQPVVARSTDDETFYRAKILASTPRGYNVSTTYSFVVCFLDV